MTGISSIQAASSAEQRYSLAVEAVGKGEKEGKAVLKSWTDLRLNELALGQLLELGKVIVQADSLHARKLSRHFESFGYVARLRGDEVLSRCRDALLYGSWVRRGIANHVHKLGLEVCPFDERLDFCAQLGEMSIQFGMQFCKYFKDLGFLEAITQAAPEERLALCERIATAGSWGADGLLQHLRDLDLSATAAEERLAFWKRWAYRGDADALVKRFAELGLDDLSFDQRLDLLKVLVRRSNTCCVAAHVSQLGAQGATLEQRLRIYRLFGSYGGSMIARAFSENYSDLGLDEAPLSARLELWKLAANDSYRRPDKLSQLHLAADIQGASSPLERLALCQEIISSCPWLSQDILEQVDFSGMSLSDKIELLAALAATSEDVAVAIIDSFADLGLEEATTEQLSYVLDHAVPPQRTPLKLLDVCSAPGLFMALPFADDFTSSDPEVALACCERLLSHHLWGAHIVAKNFSQLKLEAVPQEQRLELALKVVKHGTYPTAALLENLNLDEKPCAQLSIHVAQLDRDHAKLVLDVVEGLPLKGTALAEVCTVIATNGCMIAQKLIHKLPQLKFDGCDPSALMELYETLASQSKASAHVLAQNLQHCPLSPMTASARIQLACFIVEQNRDAADFITKQYDSLGFSDAPLLLRLHLCNTLVDKGWICSIYLHFTDEKHGFVKALQDCQDLEELHKLSITMALMGGWSATAITNSFQNLALDRLPLDSRFKLWDKMAAHSRRSCDNMADSLPSLGFLNDLEQCPNVEARLGLCLRLAQYKWGAWALAQHFQHLGLEKASSSDRLTLCRAIAKQGESASRILLHYIKNTGTMRQRTSKRLALYAIMAAQGPRAAESVAEKLGELQLGRASASQKHRLYRKIAAYEEGAWKLLRIISSIGQEQIASNRRLSLYRNMARHNRWNGGSLLEAFGQLGLIEDVQALPRTCQRLSLCRKIARCGPWAATGLTEHFDQLRLSRATISQLLPLFRIIAGADEGPAQALIAALPKLRWERASKAQRTELYIAIASQGRSAAYDVLMAMDYPNEMELYLALAKQGGTVAMRLVSDWHKLGLESTAIRDLLPLYQCLARGIGAQNMVRSLEELRFSEIPFPQRLSLYRALAAYSTSEANGLLKRIEQLGSTTEQEQIILEIATDKSPPTLSYLLEDEITDAIRPSIRALLKKEELPTLPSTHALHELQTQTSLVNDTYVKEILKRWLAYTHGSLAVQSTARQTLIKDKGLLEAIYEHRNPEDRYTLTRYLSLINTEDLEKIPSDCHRYEKITAILFYRLKHEGYKTEWIEHTLERIHQLRHFRDSTHLHDLIEFLQLLIEHPNQAQDSTSACLTRILNPSCTRKQRATSIGKNLQALINTYKLFGEEQFLKATAPNANPHALFLSQFSKIFGVKSSGSYEDSFGNFRNQTALFTYLRTLKDYPEARSTLKIYVEAVLNGKFHETRYNPELNPHLKFLFTQHPSLKEQWTTAATTQALTLDNSETERDLKAFFREKILEDGHLPHPENYPALLAYLKDEAPQNPTPFEKAIMDLCEKKSTTPLPNFDVELGELANDLEALKKQSTTGSLTISETDDPCDLLLIGTEVNGSCQRVNGDGYNKTLVSYMMNGELKAITIKKHGKIMARSMIRLLWDPKAKTPVILLERLYSNTTHPKINSAIQEWASAKAKTLGIPLTSKSYPGQKPYPNPLEFKGGLAPYTYSDAGGGCCSGCFEVRGLRLL